MRSVWFHCSHPSWCSAGLVGYIYFLDTKKPSPMRPRSRKRSFASLAADDIEEVEISSRRATTRQVQKTDGTWQLVEPVKAAADACEMIVDHQQSRRPRDPARGGRERRRPEAVRPRSGAHRRRAFAARDRQPQRIEFGEKTPTGGDIYAQAPGDSRACSWCRPFSTRRSTRRRSRCATKSILKVDRAEGRRPGADRRRDKRSADARRAATGRS